MKVYIVFDTSMLIIQKNNIKKVVGVFSNREKAQNYANELDIKDSIIEEWEVE